MRYFEILQDWKKSTESKYFDNSREGITCSFQHIFTWSTAEGLKLQIQIKDDFLFFYYLFYSYEDTLDLETFLLLAIKKSILEFLNWHLHTQMG